MQMITDVLENVYSVGVNVMCQFMSCFIAPFVIKPARHALAIFALLYMAITVELHRRINLPVGRQGYGAQECDATKAL